jgi:hypothetical protein
VEDDARAFDDVAGLCEREAVDPLEVNVEQPRAHAAANVVMRRHVGVVELATGPLDGAEESCGDELRQRVVDGGEGDGGRDASCPVQNLVGAEMACSPVVEGSVDGPSLRRRAKTAGTQDGDELRVLGIGDGSRIVLR